MKMNRFESVTLTWACFDDNTEVIAVERQAHGIKARTLFRNRPVEQVSEDDLRHVEALVEALAEALLNGVRKAHSRLF